jgi:hypothetical protein
MNDSDLKKAAQAFAVDKGSSPPLAYAERDGMLVVVLADGRKYTVTFVDVQLKAESKKQVKIEDLPAHPPSRKIARSDHKSLSGSRRHESPKDRSD